MQKLPYAFIALFAIWFSSIACFPIPVGTRPPVQRPELSPDCTEETDGTLICTGEPTRKASPSPTPTQKNGA